ncbi:NYN domain-containing protein [Oculatella sp. LEGE 06141]|uniref:NYN domain-containing protein n=1 Tax=Oculatella sp. LEGE 06141 TaxID=1828648 RepID=UPI00187ECE6A|nr:NYN domain-containing protein [Oculatella sp. LEGE 06141]MBE9179224.1 NYN domain-containing protein [Oculatella sp. LEGE 06141]
MKSVAHETDVERELTLATVHQKTVVEQISVLVHQAIVAVQKKEPLWLVEKYQTVSLQQHQVAFTRKLAATLGSAKTYNTLKAQMEHFLHQILIPVFFTSSSYQLLLNQIEALMVQSVNSTHQAVQHSTNTSPPPQSKDISANNHSLKEAIAILLLDAENLPLDSKVEAFLAEQCTYPIRVKVAFANWKSMGNKDADFHKRGYQMIHVPARKNSADMEMTAYGSSIFSQYPNAKEVLVCATDQDFNHLRNRLQVHGLTVYSVHRRGEKITLTNIQTGLSTAYYPKAETLSLKTLMSWSKTLIKEETQQTNSSWIKVSRLSQLFHQRNQLTISQALTAHYPDGKKVKDFLLDYPEEFVVHQPPGQTEPFVSLFIAPSTVPQTDQEAVLGTSTSTNKTLDKLNSAKDLETLLLQLLKQLKPAKSAGGYIPVTLLGAEFNKQYKKSINAVIKEDLKLTGTFIKFLQSVSAFEVKQNQKNWLIALK